MPVWTTELTRICIVSVIADGRALRRRLAHTSCSTVTAVVLQAASSQLTDQVQGCGDKKNRRFPSAADGQIQLHQVQLCCGAILPEH